MKRKMMVWMLAAFLAGGTALAGGQSWPAAAAAGKAEPGFVLLDRVLVLFQNLARTGSGGREAVAKGLEDIMSEAVQAKAKAQIDPAFFFRFNRLLMIMRLNFLADSKGILKDAVNRLTTDFVEDVTGARPVFDKAGEVGLGAMTGALAEEIVNLRLHIENRDRKAKLLDEWMNSFPIGK